MSERSKRIAELATALADLRAFKPTSKEELARWYELAREIEATLVEKGGLSPEVPSLLWNYLADADIRFKSAKCADLQNQQMRLLIQYLKRGEMPSNEELKEYS